MHEQGAFLMPGISEEISEISIDRVKTNRLFSEKRDCASKVLHTFLSLSRNFKEVINHECINGHKDHVSDAHK